MAKWSPEVGPEEQKDILKLKNKRNIRGINLFSISKLDLSLRDNCIRHLLSWFRATVCVCVSARLSLGHTHTHLERERRSHFKIAFTAGASAADCTLSPTVRPPRRGGAPASPRGLLPS